MNAEIEYRPRSTTVNMRNHTKGLGSAHGCSSARIQERHDKVLRAVNHPSVKYLRELRIPKERLRRLRRGDPAQRNKSTKDSSTLASCKSVKFGKYTESGINSTA